MQAFGAMQMAPCCSSNADSRAVGTMRALVMLLTLAVAMYLFSLKVKQAAWPSVYRTSVMKVAGWLHSTACYSLVGGQTVHLCVAVHSKPVERPSHNVGTTLHRRCM